MNTGVMKLKLNSIFPGTTNILVVGIIIAKQYPKVIVSKQGKVIIFWSKLLSVNIKQQIQI